MFQLIIYEGRIKGFGQLKKYIAINDCLTYIDSRTCTQARTPTQMKYHVLYHLRKKFVLQLELVKRCFRSYNLRFRSCCCWCCHSIILPTLLRYYNQEGKRGGVSKLFCLLHFLWHCCAAAHCSADCHIKGTLFGLLYKLIYTYFGQRAIEGANLKICSASGKKFIEHCQAERE